MSDNVAADQMRLFIERIERLEEEKKGISDDIKDVYLESKSQGYDTKTMRAIVRLRKMEKNARDEADALLETYKAALGMGSSESMMARASVERTPPVPPTAPADPKADAELYVLAIGLVVENQKASTSWLQRQLRVGYNQAARAIEKMEKNGIVGGPDHVGRREVLVADVGDALKQAALALA